MATSDYQKLREAYSPHVRIAECPDEDAICVQAIEFSAAIEVYVTQEQMRKLHELLSEIVNAPWNTPAEGVHWLSGNGSRPKWSKSDARFLGIQADEDSPESGEPQFDDSVYFIETTSREFVSNEERARNIRDRAG